MSEKTIDSIFKHDGKQQAPIDRNLRIKSNDTSLKTAAAKLHSDAVFIVPQHDEKRQDKEIVQGSGENDWNLMNRMPRKLSDTKIVLPCNIAYVLKNLDTYD